MTVSSFKNRRKCFAGEIGIERETGRRIRMGRWGGGGGGTRVGREREEDKMLGKKEEGTRIREGREGNKGKEVEKSI
jgi:hypothetical protein